MELEIGTIVFDAGTQVRAGIVDELVTQYVRDLAAGSNFPPVTVFHDGARYVMADGFHRARAFERAGRRTIEAYVHEGTAAEALWYALGANRAHGERLTVADRRHAIELALRTWPDRSSAVIAEQIGCDDSYVRYVRKACAHVVNSHGLGLNGSTGETYEHDSNRHSNRNPDRPPHHVIGRDGKTYPATNGPRARPPKFDRAHASARERYAQIRALAAGGQNADQIAAALGYSPGSIVKILSRENIRISGKRDHSRKGAQARYERIRALAARGWSMEQIAEELGYSREGLAVTVHREKIHVPAAKVLHGSHRHNANRIVQRMALDAETLTADVHLIDFAALDPEKLPQWIEAFAAARRALDLFIARLRREAVRERQ